MKDTVIATLKPKNRDDYEVSLTEAWDRQQTLNVHNMLMPDRVAETALGMMSRWGTVAAIPDGEDSSGRSKVRLQTAAELTTYAFDAAEAFWRAAEERGHLLAMPDHAERKHLLDEARKVEDGN